MHSKPPADHVATLPSRRGALVPPRRRTLLVMAGEAMATHGLPLEGEITVGRASKCDIQIDHPSISRAHLMLALSEDEVTVTDLESVNGTSLRGVRLPHGVAVQVSANEAIGAGDVTLVVQEIRAGAGPAAPAPLRPSGQLVRAPSEPVVIDPAMRRLYDLAARVARGTISVLLVGETGTGKEVLAEFVHRMSPRAAGPLVRANCAALSETLIESELFGHERGAFTGAQRDRRGLLEAADGGTVFLDEIGEVPLRVQAKLLRVLEEGQLLRVGASSPRPLDVRFIAATNRDLEADVAAGRFRRDLYFRLAGAVLAIPPLRERRDEIEALARRFAAEAAARIDRPMPQLGDGTLAALTRHPWPGNVRELRNVVERAVLLAEGPVIAVHDLPFDGGQAAMLAPDRAARAGDPAAPAAATAADDSAAGNAGAAGSLPDQLAAIERQRIVDALEHCGGNQTRAAELLGMPRRTFVKRLNEYGVRRPRKK